MPRHEGEDDERLNAVLVIVVLITLPPSLIIGSLFGNLIGPNQIPPANEARVQCASGEPYNVSEAQSHSLGTYFADSHYTAPQSRYYLAKTVQVPIVWILMPIACVDRANRPHQFLAVEDGLGAPSPDDVRAALNRAREKRWANESRWLYPWCTAHVSCLLGAPYQTPSSMVTANWVAWGAIVFSVWVISAATLLLSGYMEREDRALRWYRQLVALRGRLAKRDTSTAV